SGGSCPAASSGRTVAIATTRARAMTTERLIDPVGTVISSTSARVAPCPSSNHAELHEVAGYGIASRRRREAPPLKGGLVGRPQRQQSGHRPFRLDRQAAGVGPPGVAGRLEQARHDAKLHLPPQHVPR